MTWQAATHALSIGYAYSGYPTDQDFLTYGLPPAAVGYDFFQGPLVDGVAGQDLNKNDIDDAIDSGIFNLKKVGPGKINLPMSSFYYFASGSNINDPTTRMIMMEHLSFIICFADTCRQQI